MSDLFYEHHTNIRKDMLCPFILSFRERALDCICNWHENIEVLLVTEGSGTLRYGNVDMEVCAEDMIVVNSRTIHRLYSETGVSYQFIIIDELFCAENGLSVKERSFTPIVRSEQSRHLFCELVRAIEDYRNGGNGFQLKAAKARLSVIALLIELCEHHSKIEEHCENRKKPSEEYIKSVISYMADHYREDLTLESLSAICGITKYYLAREFKRYTGQTVFAFLNTLRCKNADICLSEGKSVTEAAYECGFESISYFSRTYKKINGIPPSEFSKKQL